MEIRRGVNGEAVFETEWGPFPKLEGGKHQVGSDAEVRISIKGEKDQSGRGILEGTFFSGLKRTFADSAWMLRLVSLLRFVEEVRNIPRLHFILQ